MFNLSGSGCGSTAFLWFWLLGWTAGTLTFDVVIAWGIVESARSTSFLETTGDIFHSEVVAETDDDGGRHFSADIRYKFSVDDVEYEGDVIRFAAMDGIGGEDARATVARLPVGKQTTVFYDANDPSRSALQCGLSMEDFFAPLFLLPFNIVMIGMSYWLLGRPLRQTYLQRPERLSLRRRGTVHRVRLLKYSPLLASAIAALAISFVSVFCVGFAAFLVGAAIIPFAWLAVIGGAIWAYRQWSVVLLEVELDEFHRKLTIRPQGHESQTYNFSDLASIEARVPWNADDEDEINEKAAVRLTPRHGGGEEVTLKCHDAQRADWLAAWLQTRVLAAGAS